MKVLHVITGLTTGGAEMMLYKLLSSANRARATSVVSLCDRGTLGEPIEALGVPVHTLGMRRGIPGLRPLLRLRRLIRQEQPDLIQGWMYHANLASTLAAWRASQTVPVAWNIRYSLDDLSSDKRLTRWLIHFGGSLSSTPATIVYNSRQSALQHERLGYAPGKTIVIPNGFDCERFKPNPASRRQIRQELGVAEDAWLIGHFARYHPMKDHASFLTAAALLRQRAECDLFFVMAGQGVDRSNPELERMLDRLKLTDCCRLLGERRDIPDLMGALDISTSSASTGEAFPNVVGEAMACGAPCVVTDVGDSATIVGDTGRVVPPSDPESIAAAWLDLIKSGKQKVAALGAAARRRIQHNYSLSLVAEQYEALYQRVIGEETRKG
jgi:glycosyltransferase involved in cell wall biosynthesis